MNGNTPMKQCTKCGEWKPATSDYFTKHKQEKSGLYSRCKLCKQAADRKRWAANADAINARRRNITPDQKERVLEIRRQWRSANREKVLEYKRRYYWANREAGNARSRSWANRNRERKRQYDKEYLQANRRNVQRRKRAWEASNKERLLEKRRSNYASNPVPRRLSYTKREAIKRNLPSLFADSDLRICLEWFGNRCATCNADGPLHMDHWVPLKSEICPGTVRENMIPLCESCNCSKQDTDATEWLIFRFGSTQAQQILHRIKAYFSSLSDSATS